MSHTRAFCSYAENDYQYFKEFERHLSSLQRSGCIELWSQHKVSPGDALAERIAEALEDADLVLFLVSSDFITSTRCFDFEMKRALELAELGQVVAVPILLRDCDWSSMPFANLHILPSNKRPIASYTETPLRDEAWADVARVLRLMLGRYAPAHRAAPARAITSRDLEVIILQFLGRWSRWGFNAARLRNWGSRQPGFGILADFTTEDIKAALERLASSRKVDTFQSKAGSRLYKAS
ncbi:MAG TPA: toll/interleukin-1 receptor domain-containing protein [Sorangium sp.]|nr:toll/interleukin-1 receptor domain-containing protein [Sorangium sp.]